MKEPKELSFSLQAVRVQSLDASLELDFDPGVPDQPLQGVFIVSGQRLGRITLQDPAGVEYERFTFLTAFEFRYHNTPSRDTFSTEELENYKVVARIVANIASVYAEKPIEQIDERALHIWGIRNAVMHQWPYWRELCATTLTRMGLPIVPVPLWSSPPIQEFKDVPDPAASEVIESVSAQHKPVVRKKAAKKS